MEELLDFTQDLSLHVDELEEMILMLSTKIIIDSLNRICYLKYHRGVHGGVEKKNPCEVEAYLRDIVENILEEHIL